MRNDTRDPRLYCQFAHLVRLQAQINTFSFLPRLNAGTALSGRHSSRFRGRGLNFEELRHYQPGDDIRNLDWRVTIRTGKPHVRLYTEEKDRNVLVCVDQRSEMFFSSQVLMKSVVAAEIAALIGWRVLKDNDRIGFLIASPKQFAHVSAKRSQPHLMRALQQLTNTNQSLNAQSQNEANVRFSNLVHTLSQLRPQSWTIILISDWHDATEADIQQLQYLQRNNNVLGIFVTDPLEASLPHSLHQQAWVVGEGPHQLSLDSAGKVSAASATLSQHVQQTRLQLTQLMARNEMPLVELDTAGQHLQAFQQAIGGYR